MLRGTLRLRERRDEDEILGHLDNLLGNRQIKVPARLQQLVSPLRPRNVQNMHHEHDIGELLPAAHPDRVAGNRKALPQTTGQSDAQWKQKPMQGLPETWDLHNNQSCLRFLRLRLEKRYSKEALGSSSVAEISGSLFGNILNHILVLILTRVGQFSDVFLEKNKITSTQRRSLHHQRRPAPS